MELREHIQNLQQKSKAYNYSFLTKIVISTPYFIENVTSYSDRLHDFSFTIPRCYKDVYVNSFFPRTAKLWNSLSIECFSLTYDLNGFTSRINRHLLTVASF